VDPHLHRILSLDQAIPIKNAISLSAADEIGRFLKQKLEHALLLGPDGESEQWVANIANKIGFDYCIAHKERGGDKQISMTLPDIKFLNKTIVIIDDIASTGRTLGMAARLLKTAGAGDIYAVVTHALFCGDAEAHILQSGVQTVWSTDSINHPASCIKLDALLVDAIKALI
jgi:ribose-phosphate pyrophosphokinase